MSPVSYRTLGRTGLSVSPICIGAWQLGGPLAFDGLPDGHPDPGRDAVIDMIRELGDLGVNCIDTAEQYGGGESERRVGAALEGQRDRWIVSTKFGYRVAGDGSREDDSGPLTIMPSLEGSLRRLRTNYIDIYLFHCEPRVEDLEASRAVLEQARAQGKIRFYGISTGNLDLVRRFDAAAMLDVVQYPVSLLDPAPDTRAFLGTCEAGVQVRGIMAGGRLSGKYFRHRPRFPGDDRRSVDFRNEDLSRYAALEACLPAGYTMAQAALRWVLDQPCHHTVCAGAKTIEDYRVMLQALDLPPLGEPATRQLEACAKTLLG